MKITRSGLILVLTLAALSGAAVLAQRGQGAPQTQIQPGQPCPPGQTEVRPGRCQAPEFPPPSIVDYRPLTSIATWRAS